MSDKHTPGPWSLSTEGSPSPLLTRITGSGAAVWPWSEEDRANARLIAAAPELLAEIQSALATAQDGLEHMDSGDEEGARMALDVICSGLEDAINNATKEEA